MIRPPLFYAYRLWHFPSWCFKDPPPRGSLVGKNFWEPPPPLMSAPGWGFCSPALYLPPEPPPFPAPSPGVPIAAVPDIILAKEIERVRLSVFVNIPVARATAVAIWKLMKYVIANSTHNKSSKVLENDVTFTRKLYILAKNGN